MYRFHFPLLNPRWNRRLNFLDSGEDQRIFLLNYICLIFEIDGNVL
jgi:hypothetical protein